MSSNADTDDERIDLHTMQKSDGTVIWADPDDPNKSLRTTVDSVEDLSEWA